MTQHSNEKKADYGEPIEDPETLHTLTKASSKLESLKKNVRFDEQDQQEEDETLLMNQSTGVTEL